MQLPYPPLPTASLTRQSLPSRSPVLLPTSVDLGVFGVQRAIMTARVQVLKKFRGILSSLCVSSASFVFSYTWVPPRELPLPLPLPLPLAPLLLPLRPFPDAAPLLPSRKGASGYSTGRVPPRASSIRGSTPPSFPRSPPLTLGSRPP